MAIRKVVRANSNVKWEVRIHENGRGSKRIKRVFDKKIDAEKFLFDFKSSIKEKQSDVFKDCSFDDRYFREEAEYWLRDGELRFSPGHLVRVKSILNEIYGKFRDLKIQTITPEFLSRYQHMEKSKGLSNATVNRKTEVIVAVLNFAEKQRRIPFNPSKGFSKLRRQAGEMLFWSEAEALSFLASVDSAYPRQHEQRWVYIVYLLALNTGMRAGEIWGLKPLDIAADGKSLWIRRQFNRVSLELGPTKGRKARHVPCPGIVLEELKLWIRRRGVSSEETVFQNTQGNPVCHDNFTDRQFAKDLKRWGGRVIRFHDLRHTATTLMISKGIDVKTVKEVCGHADVATTMNYVHLVAGAVQKLSEMFIVGPARLEDRKMSIVKGSVG